MPDNALITLTHVSCEIDKRPILHDINLTIHAGELLTIVGPNGAGKSTLLKLLLGHLPPTSGRIARKPGIKLAYVPQKFSLPRDLPVTVARFLSDLPQSALEDTLERLSIGHLRNHSLQTLSGGETQRLLLARAMLTHPDIIMLDEPAAGIDPGALGQYYQTIRDYQLAQKCSIVMVSHDLHLVMAASDRVICINRHICCSGTPQDVLAHPQFQHLSGTEYNDSIGVYTHHHRHIHL